MEVSQLWPYTFGTKALVNLCPSVKEEIKAFTFAHLPQRNGSFQMYRSLSYSDVSHQALTERCFITYGGVKFYEMTEAARRLSVLPQPSPGRVSQTGVCFLTPLVAVPRRQDRSLSCSKQ